MTTHTIRSARVAAAVAGLGLVVSAMAPMAMAQTTTTTTTTTTTATFSRDLTIGSTGADVTALQNWLIAKGHTIAAGATGYFGAQTKAALAAYQASAGITPAAGYFGPITRAKIAVPTTPSKPVPQPNETDDEKETRDALKDARAELEDAEDEVEDADREGKDINDAKGILEDAENNIEEAEEALSNGDLKEANARIETVLELIEEALDEIESGRTSNKVVSTSATAQNQDGADNDIGTFKISISLSAFNKDAYISRTPSTSFEYEIQDSNGNAVSGATTESAILQSSADRDGNYYLLEDGSEHTFTLTVTFDPLAEDEGQNYLLQLIGVNYANTDSSPDREWRASPAYKYQTDYVYIAD